MAITIKTAEQIEKMRIAGQLAASVLEMIEPHVKTGVTTGYLDQLCHNYIVDELMQYLPHLTITASLNQYAHQSIMLFVTEFRERKNLKRVTLSISI